MSRSTIVGKGSFVLQGRLLKRGPMVDFKWEERWCVLYQTVLEYYTNISCQEKRGAIPIEALTVAFSFKASNAPGDSVKHVTDHPYGFAFGRSSSSSSAASKKREIFYFDACDEVQLELWLKAMKMAAGEALPNELIDVRHAAMLLGMSPHNFTSSKLGESTQVNERMLSKLIEMVGSEAIHLGAFCRAAQVAQTSANSVQNLMKLLATCSDYDPQVLTDFQFGICLRVPADPLAQASLLVPVKLLKQPKSAPLWMRVRSFVSLRCLGAATEQWVDYELGVVKLFFDSRPGVPVAVGNIYEFGGAPLTVTQIKKLCGNDGLRAWLMSKFEQARKFAPEREALWQSLEYSILDEKGTLAEGCQFRSAEAVVRISSREVSREFAERVPFYVKTTYASAHPSILASLAKPQTKVDLLKELRVAEEWLRLQKAAREAENRFACKLGTDPTGALRKTSTLCELVPHLLELRQESPLTTSVQQASNFIELTRKGVRQNVLQKFKVLENECLCQGALTKNSEIEANGREADEIRQSHIVSQETKEYKNLLEAAESVRKQLFVQLAAADLWTSIPGIKGDPGRMETTKSTYAECVLDFGLKTIEQIERKLDRQTWLCSAGVPAQASASSGCLYDICSFRLYYGAMEDLIKGLEKIKSDFKVVKVINRFSEELGEIGHLDIQVLVELKWLGELCHIAELLLSVSHFRDEHERLYSFRQSMADVLARTCKPKPRGYRLQAFLEQALMKAAACGLQMHDVEWQKPADRGIVFIVQGVEKQEHHHMWSCADKGPKVDDRFFKECTEDELCYRLMVLLDDLVAVRLLCFASVLLRMVYSR